MHSGCPLVTDMVGCDNGLNDTLRMDGHFFVGNLTLPDLSHKRERLNQTY